MDILGNLFEMLINIIESIIGAQFYIRYLGYKNEKHNKVILLIIILSHFVAISVGNYFVFLSKYTSFVTFAVWIFVIITFLKGRVVEKLFLVEIHKIINATIGIMLLSIFDKLITYDINGYMNFGAVRISLVIIAKLSELLLLELVLRFRVKQSEFVSDRVYILLSSIVFATLISQEYIIDIIYNQAYANQLANDAKIVAVSLAIFDLLVYGLCMILTKNSVELLKERMKNAAYESKMKDIQHAKELNQCTMKIRHDMKNVLLNIRIKLENDGIDEAVDYLDNVLNVKLSAQKILFTDNYLVDAVINNCTERCKERNIKMELIIDCAIDRIEEMDMAVILSNLLDNAIEAAEQTSERFIELKICRVKNYLHIQVCNSCNGIIIMNENLLQTTKKDTIYHGYGLLNVKDIVNKYNGEYEGRLIEKEYVTDILLYLPDLTV